MIILNPWLPSSNGGFSVLILLGLSAAFDTSVPSFLYFLDFLFTVAPFFMETHETHWDQHQEIRRCLYGVPFQSNENCVFISWVLCTVPCSLFPDILGTFFATEKAGCDAWLYVRKSVSFRSLKCCDFWKQPNEESFLKDSFAPEAWPERKGTLGYIGRPPREVM